MIMGDEIAVYVKDILCFINEVNDLKDKQTTRTSAMLYSSL